jgi:large subunit ribosomal protein L24
MKDTKVHLKLRKGDRVRVLTGKDVGKEGAITRVLADSNRVIVDGVNVAKKHQRQTKATMQAGIIDKDMPIDASNVAILSRGKPSRIGFRIEDGKKVRVAVKTGEVLA